MTKNSNFHENLMLFATIFLFLIFEPLSGQPSGQSSPQQNSQGAIWGLTGMKSPNTKLNQNSPMEKIVDEEVRRRNNDFQNQQKDKLVEEKKIAQHLFGETDPNSTETLVNWFKKYSPSIVVIRNSRNDNTQAQGSGICIGQNGYITNYHVIENSKRIVVSQGKTQSEGYVTKVFPKADFAVVVTNSQIGICLPQTIWFKKYSHIEVGEEVFAIGCPLGLEASLSNGIVSGLRKINGVPVVQTTAPISPGSSGGALFNKNGHFIGLTTFCFIDGQNLNFAIPILEIMGFMESAQKEGAPAKDERSISQPGNAEPVPPLQDMSPEKRKEIDTLIYKEMERYVGNYNGVLLIPEIMQENVSFTVLSKGILIGQLESQKIKSSGRIRGSLESNVTFF